MAYPPPPNNLWKIVKAKHPDGRTRLHKIVSELHTYQKGSKTKLIYLQKIMLENGKEELRLGYYIISKKKGRMFGRWVWGQYATFLPACDLRKIVKMATAKGWL